MPHQVLIERRQCGEPAADRRRRRAFDLVRIALPGDHRLWSAWRSSSGVAINKVRMKCLHVEPIGAAGARTLLLREPDFFLGDRGKGREG